MNKQNITLNTSFLIRHEKSSSSFTVSQDGKWLPSSSPLPVEISAENLEELKARLLDYLETLDIFSKYDNDPLASINELKNLITKKDSLSE